MKTDNCASIPELSRPGNDHPGHWAARYYSDAFMALLLFALIFGVTVILGYRQFATARNNALVADKTAANLLAEILLERNRATIGVLQSYARRPLFVAAVQGRDLAGVQRHLMELKKNAEIDLTFVTDPRGVLWANFPVFPESIGQDLSYRDWYRGVSAHWQPYISAVFKLIIGDRPPAAAVCVPIFAARERPIGILATSQRLDYLAAVIRKAPFSPFTKVSVIDRREQILYSNRYPYREKVAEYRFSSIVAAALKDKKQQVEIGDPQHDGGKSYLTIVPVGDIGWTVVTERLRSDIHRSELSRFIEIGGIFFLLFILIAFSLGYLRKMALIGSADNLRLAEMKLRRSEEAERETREYLENLIDYANAPIIVWDPQFRITRFNHAFETLTGLPAAEVLGKEIDLLFPEDRREECLGHIRQTTGGQRWEVIEIPILHRNGSVRTLLWNSATIYVPNGNTAIATIAQGQDITDRKRAEAEIQASLREKETLLKEIHHRVKNNLQIISSLLRLQMQYVNDCKMETIFRECQDRIMAMASVHSLLYKSRNFSEIEFGEYVQEMVAELLRSYQPNTAAVSLTVNMRNIMLSIETAIPCGLIINELVTNALKYAFPGVPRGEIVVEMKRTEKELLVLVADNGIGFPRDIDFRNTGTFGLKLVHLLVKQLGGSIDQYLDGGTRYVIIIKQETSQEG